MKKASILLICYLLSLFGFSLFFSRFGVKEFIPKPSTWETLVHPMMLVTVFAGLSVLKFIVPSRSFKIFLILYCCLWILRIPVNYINIQVTKNIGWYEHYGFNRFAFRYYDHITKICTPLPFIIFWFVNYFFSILRKNLEKENKLPPESISTKI